MPLTGRGRFLRPEGVRLMKRWLTITAAAILIAAVLPAPSVGAYAISATPWDAPIPVPPPQPKPSKPKPAKPAVLSKPVCAIDQPVLVDSKLRLSGKCRYSKKTAEPKWRWQVLGETDASNAPLPVPAASANGTGVWVPVPVVGGYSLKLKAVLSTPKTKAHQAASKTVTFSVPLGGYTAVGTTKPMFEVWADNPYSYVGWSQTVEVSDGSPYFRLPQNFMVPPSMSGCRAENLKPEPPTDVVPPQNRGDGTSAGTVTATGLTVYGYRVVCSTGYTAIVQAWARFAYYSYENGQGRLDSSCELPLAGVTSFTVPPQWGGYITIHAVLLTFGPDGRLFNANQTVLHDPPYQVRTKGAVNVCKEYHLPPINLSRINT